MAIIQQEAVAGVILAGGQSRRMGYKDKALLPYRNLPLISHCITAMSPVTDSIAISANRNIDEYKKFNLPVLPDQDSQFAGPLAGILAAMEHLQAFKTLLVMPCDCPLFQSQHLRKLLAGKQQACAEITTAHDGNRTHPVFLALDTRLHGHLRNYLQEGNHKVESWIRQHKLSHVDFSAEPAIFLNINTPQDFDHLAFNP